MRDFGGELDALRIQVAELERAVRHIAGQRENSRARPDRTTGQTENSDALGEAAGGEAGEIYYSGHYRSGGGGYKWEPQTRSVAGLLDQDAEWPAKIVAALGHKQRLDILRALIRRPMTGAELVEKLNMGTTGQLYHHLKALLGAGLLEQEERGGHYAISGQRVLPLLLLLAAAGDMAETGRYIDMAEARSRAGDYLGAEAGGYDPHLLLWAIVDNAVLEHRAGHCSEVAIFLHEGGAVTVADDGRGIPVRALAQTGEPIVQEVLTNMRMQDLSHPYVAPGAEKSISVAVVNALSHRLTVEVKCEGSVFRQQYKNGIPQSGLLTVGVTKETGTSITFEPDRELFARGFELRQLEVRAAEWREAYPQLNIVVRHEG